MTSSSLVGVQTELRDIFDSFRYAQKAEEQLVKELRALELQYLRQLKQAGHVEGWMFFLKRNDAHSMERTKWDLERSSIKANLPIDYGLHRLSAFVEYVRASPACMSLVAEYFRYNSQLMYNPKVNLSLFLFLSLSNYLTIFCRIFPL